MSYEDEDTCMSMTVQHRYRSLVEERRRKRRRKVKFLVIQGKGASVCEGKRARAV